VSGPRTIPALQREIRRCRRCRDAGYPIVPPPVVAGEAGRQAYLFGLAPGRVEADRGRPWQGRAGVTIRRWLRMSEEAFFDTFYCASVTRCYPGRAATGRGDRTATAAEQRLCADWTFEELRLLRPGLIVTVGLTPARRLIGACNLTDAIGKSFLLDEAIVIPLPHPSGASGWLNDPVNRARLGKALVHVRRELAALPAGRSSHTIAT
jgi:uracil-DNA glycosylase